MKVEYIEETSVRKSLTFEIEAEVVSREIDARAQDYARQVKIPGFRPGKIPPGGHQAALPAAGAGGRGGEARQPGGPRGAGGPGPAAPGHAAG